jgi:hypothetical protein
MTVSVKTPHRKHLISTPLKFYMDVNRTSPDRALGAGLLTSSHHRPEVSRRAAN